MSEPAGTVLEEPVVSSSKPAPVTRTKQQPQYVVIVENDECHTFNYVILALGRVCGHSFERALELAMQIHTAGRAPVWTGAMEVAELKRDQIREFGPDTFATKTVTFPLGVYIEPLS